ncbi:hypothetical protein TRIP_E350036 [uncultured Spirochaetota bacterium]|nr:hypothetical protein TRIP_E350036 [uncultured Spirochaetota bacterium]
MGAEDRRFKSARPEVGGLSGRPSDDAGSGESARPEASQPQGSAFRLRTNSSLRDEFGLSW